MKEINDYDQNDTSFFIDKAKPKTLADLDIKLPEAGPTRVVSLRLPLNLLNKLKAYSTDIDMPYQAYIKYLLNKGLKQDLAKEIKKDTLGKD